MNFENTIIENINENAKTLKISSVRDFEKFMYKTKTEQSDIIMKQIREYIVVSDKLIYYYNENTKLWICVDDKQYNKLLYDFLLNTNKKVAKLMIEEQSKNEITNREVKEINEFLIKKFDEETYINTITKRSSTLLYNPNFVSLLDSSKECFPIKNGRKINFRTLEISSRTNLDFFTFESPVEFLENTPNADKFFEQLFDNKENREYVRKVMGYNLTAETFCQVFFVWYGFGSNGKSLLSKLLELILCKQYCTCDESIFIKNKKSQGQATPEIMALLGKRTGIYSEGETADNIEMNEGSIKRISGEDKITGRYLFSNQVEFYPYIKLNMATNFVPSFGADEAMKRRLRYLFFDRKFVSNPTKSNEIKIDIEFAEKIRTIYLSEIFSWMAKGANEVYKNKSIIMPDEYKLRTEKILSEGDSIESFIKRRIIKSDVYEDTLKKNDLFDAYKTFCNENSQRCIARTTLWARISQLGINTRPLHGYDVYYGIKIDLNNKKSDYDFGIEQNNIIDDDLIIANLKNENSELKNKLKELEAQILQLQLTKKEEIKQVQKTEEITEDDVEALEKELNDACNDFKPKQQEEKVYLTLPFTSKEDVKRNGAIYDSNKKEWYVLKTNPKFKYLTGLFNSKNVIKTRKGLEFVMYNIDTKEFKFIEECRKELVIIEEEEEDEPEPKSEPENNFNEDDINDILGFIENTKNNKKSKKSRK